MNNYFNKLKRLLENDVFQKILLFLAGFIIYIILHEQFGIALF